MGQSGRDQGASAVEFAILLPLLLVVLFGMLWGGLVLNEQQQINHAAREASRFASTFGSPEFGQPGAFDATASRASSTSQGITHRDEALLCVMYWDGSDIERRWYELDTATSTAAPADPDANCPIQISDATAEPWVQVSIRMPTEINAVFVTLTPTLNADAVSIYEPTSS